MGGVQDEPEVDRDPIVAGLLARNFSPEPPDEFLMNDLSHFVERCGINHTRQDGTRLKGVFIGRHATSNQPDWIARCQDRQRLVIEVAVRLHARLPPKGSFLPELPPRCRRCSPPDMVARTHSSTLIPSFSVSSLYRFRIVTSVTPATSATSRWVRRSFAKIDAM